MTLFGTETLFAGSCSVHGLANSFSLIKFNRIYCLTPKQKKSNLMITVTCNWDTSTLYFLHLYLKWIRKLNIQCICTHHSVWMTESQQHWSLHPISTKRQQHSLVRCFQDFPGFGLFFITCQQSGFGSPFHSTRANNGGATVISEKKKCSWVQLV